ATGVSVSVGMIDLTFNTGVTLSDASLVGLTSVQTQVSVTNKKVQVTFGELEKGKQYKLTVAAGAVKSTVDGTPCQAWSLSFTTEEDSVPQESIDPRVEPSVDPDATISSEPVTEGVTQATRSLYSYLLSIWGESVLSASMAKVNWNNYEGDWVAKYTGKHPAIATYDYIHLPESPANWIDYGDISPAREWFDAGGIIASSWHWRVPKREGSSDYVYDNTTSFQAKNVPVDGTWENTVAKADLDKVAGYLLLLQDAGIPVLWRPLHEAAGNTYATWNQSGSKAAWFWWGYDGPDAYKTLWRYMFDYLAQKGVKNLIWVWTTQTSSAADQDWAYYPGDDYVDIVGRDIYGSASSPASAASIASQFSTVEGYWPQKMITLSECGAVDTLPSQWTAGAKWLYAMPWYDYDNDGSRGYAHGHADIAWWTAAFASEKVLAREDLPEDLYTK
ncbi:MAG: hypothetical protein II720_01840, partial [Bacteroidales bacterium]|nr:hypothetical protein [Bacteroidales bacterium]